MQKLKQKHKLKKKNHKILLKKINLINKVKLKKIKSQNLRLIIKIRIRLIKF